MAVEFEKLKFTRDWNSSADFPTYEENEQKVRADLQALHDETKNFINETLIPGIENMAVPGTGDMLADVYDPQGKRTDVYKYAENYVDSSVGPVSDAFELHFGNQNNPHKVTAEQVMVTENVVNTIKETGGWSVDGILAQIGSTLFGSEATNSVYRWRKERSRLVLSNTRVDSTNYPYSKMPTFYYSSEVDIDSSGNIKLVNPSSIKLSGSNADSVRTAIGNNYYSGSTAASTLVYKITENGTITVTMNDTGYTVKINQIEIYKGEFSSELVTSTDPNAHYDGEVDADGYTYTELEPLMAFVPRIQTGSYAGTGTYGKDNPTSLTFSFAPKIVFMKVQGAQTRAIFVASSFGSSFTNNAYFASHSATGVMSCDAKSFARVDGNTLEWYNTDSAVNQLNYDTLTYSWVAIG